MSGTRSIPPMALGALVVALAAEPGFAAQQPLTTELVAPVVGFPVGVEWAPGDRQRMFVVDITGRIEIWKNGAQAPTPFLDISNLVSNNGSQGLLGIVFHPDYASNGWVFVNFTDLAGDTEIARFTVDPNDPDRLDPNSKQVVLRIVQPYANHNGGCMEFGPDGYLYIATGDGGLAGDPGNRAQSPTSLLGKMLRIDVDQLPYVSPASNMGAQSATAFDEIFAVGLRHPWRFSFDRESGDLWIADVGQALWEEVNRVRYSPVTGWPGWLNFGWRLKEGTHCFNPSTNCVPTFGPLEEPVFEYGHTLTPPFRCSVTGGFVYRGAAMSRMHGRYFLADYCSGEIFSLEQDPITWRWRPVDHSGEIGNPGEVVAFGEDPDGELVVVATSGILRIVPDGLRVQVEGRQAGLLVEVTVSGAGAGQNVWLAGSEVGLGNLTLPQYGVTVALTAPVLLATGPADASGSFTAQRTAPATAAGYSIWLQAFVADDSSNVYALRIE